MVYESGSMDRLSKVLADCHALAKRALSLHSKSKYFESTPRYCFGSRDRLENFTLTSSANSPRHVLNLWWVHFPLPPAFLVLRVPPPTGAFAHCCSPQLNSTKRASSDHFSGEVARTFNDTLTVTCPPVYGASTANFCDWLSPPGHFEGASDRRHYPCVNKRTWNSFADTVMR